LKKWQKPCNYLIKIVIIFTRETTLLIKNIKYILLTFFLSTAISSFSQEIKTTLILGKVVDEQTHQPIPGTNIYTKHYGTVSDIDGNFSFELSPQDTITCSFVGYENTFFTLEDATLSAQIEIAVLLKPSLKELEEVVVRALMTERNFKDAVIAYKLPKEKKVQQLPGFYYGSPKPMKAKAFTSPISYLANKFGQQAKQERHFEKQKIAFRRQKLINAKYNKEIVANITGLYGDELDDFMHFCKPSEAQIEAASEYDMTLTINKCLDDFKNKN